MKLLIYIGFILAGLGLSVHIYNSNAVRAELAKKFEALASQSKNLEEDNKKIESGIQYLSDPHNLEKEARSKYNFRAPNEKLIIVVPQSN